MAMLNRIHRRTFLERSLLGAGGLLFSSSLLQSCTDHDIPDPASPLQPPLLGGSIDWNDDAKTMTTSAIEMIPEVGDLLGGLLEIFWPSSKEDVWGEIKAQVEALVDQKIAAQVYVNVQGNLTGLNNSLVSYVNEVKNGTQEEILTQWMITKNLFELYQPNFQSTGNELPLLPLFGQFANLYLALLRDGVSFGLSWGRTPADHQQDIKELKDAISSFTTWTTNTFFNGRNALIQKTKADSHHIEPFKTVNTYDRQMSQTVLSFMDVWPFFDVTQFPNGTTAEGIYRREIYSDPFGTADNSGNIVITTPIPTQFPTNVTVWAYDRIDAVQVTYPSGSGPGGVTQTKRMGDSSGGTSNAPIGGSFNLTPENPITHARASYGSIINAMAFTWANNTTTPWMGAHNGIYGADSDWVGYTNTALSSIHINGISDFYGSADLVVFGFQPWTAPAARLNAIRALYIRTPKERSAADFSKQFSKVAVPANLITEELKAARKAYWEDLQARAKANK